ncbi:hypothetical protein DAPPUDRAFT_309293 [Daphnia pulex]|uniref:Uncharacterized protein n=1 Tax=Daphnia pulex TaxID=6669 RepID=E9HBV9_DAPPU|nr:hypothetical protein DAPPUDRAFT_309293 [Daphnia pulex]|eukprot:EFX70804.1 hypothetical protein DAPPUDRAFT_309293 [Daphnia pulex]
MEEDISKSLKSALEDALTEDEAIENNWTFVLTENVSLTKNNGADMSDNYSEQGSDSGSSIVVIDSPVLPSCDLHPVLGDTVNQQLLKNVEGQSEGFDLSDNISCSSHQSSNNGFLKECSPYEEIEQPDTWDCDYEADQPDGEESKTSNNSLANSQLLVEDIEALVVPTENDVETNTNLEFVQNEKTILKEFLVAENSPLTNDVTCQEDQTDIGNLEESRPLD